METTTAKAKKRKSRDTQRIDWIEKQIAREPVTEPGGRYFAVLCGRKTVRQIIDAAIKRDKGKTLVEIFAQESTLSDGLG